MKLTKNYTTTLEALPTGTTVGAILDAKLEATSPEQVTDYVAFAVDNLEANIQRAKDAKSELDAYIKDAQSKIEDIKIGTSKWLKDAGVDKLDGMRVSSITAYEPKPKEELKIYSESYFLNNPEFVKTTLDTTAIKKFLQDTEMDHSEYAEIVTTHKEPTLKINKKRG